MGMAIITRFVPAVVLAAGLLPGQGQMPQTLGEVPQQYMDLLRSDVRAKKKQIVKQVVGLSEEQGAKFWPLHEAYEKELDALQGERLKLLQDYEQKWADLSETQVSAYLHRLLDLRIRRDKLLQKYFKSMARAAGATAAARFVQIEHQMLTVMDMQIIAMVPLIR